MLKLRDYYLHVVTMYQPPSGGCVLKHKSRHCHGNSLEQPPSGGCVLKPTGDRYTLREPPAAFGRLCVETIRKSGRL